MSIIAMVSGRGGVGKSCLSSALAVEAARGGLSVRIADLDWRQKSALDWHGDRVLNNLIPSVECQLFRTYKEALKRASDVDLLIVDAAGMASDETMELARHADLVVQPSKGSKRDLRPAVRVFNSLHNRGEGIPLNRLLMVLNMILTPTEAEGARAYMADTEYRYRVGPGYIPDKQAYRDLEDTGRALSEVRYPTLKKAVREVLEGIIAAVPEPETTP